MISTLLVLARPVTRLGMNKACMGACMGAARCNCIPFFPRPTLYNSSESSRSSLSQRDAISSTLHIQKQKCLICFKTQVGAIRDKYRICESPRAKRFLEATIHFQDELYRRVADLKAECMYLETICTITKTCFQGKLNKKINN